MNVRFQPGFQSLASSSAYESFDLSLLERIKMRLRLLLSNAALGAWKRSLTSPYEDANIKVLTDTNMTPEQLKALSDRVTAAYKYDLAQEQWRDPGTTQGKFDVIILSKATWTQMFPPGVGGVTVDKNTIILPEEYVGKEVRPFDMIALSHELLHIQDLRQAGFEFFDVPVYFREGKAFVIGDAYGETFEDNHLYMRHVAREATELTDTLLAEDFAKDMPTWGNELGGSLFIEYLRTRIGGDGYDDAWKRAAEVVNLVGEGKSYNAAFQSQFGVAPDAAVAEFLRFIDATENDPVERLKGTIYEQPEGLPFPPDPEANAEAA
jgi:hypothetical protein